MALESKNEAWNRAPPIFLKFQGIFDRKIMGSLCHQKCPPLLKKRPLAHGLIYNLLHLPQRILTDILVWFILAIFICCHRTSAFISEILSLYLFKLKVWTNCDVVQCWKVFFLFKLFLFSILQMLIKNWCHHIYKVLTTFIFNSNYIA